MSAIQIVIDEREHALYDLLMAAGAPIPILKQVLDLGDIVIRLNDRPVLVLERKSFDDLFASIKDGRYQEQSYRLIHGSGLPVHSIGYLLEGITTQISEQQRNLLYATMISLNQYKGFSVFRTAHVRETADFVLAVATKIQRNARDRKEFPIGYVHEEPVATASGGGEAADQDAESIPSVPSTAPPPYSSVVKTEKKANITPENIGAILLCQIPSINTATAEQIMSKYGTLRQLLDSLSANPDELGDFYTTTSSGGRRKLSRAIVENIKKFLV